MIAFTADAMIISIHTGLNPTEDWMELQKELMDIISVASNNNDVKVDIWRTMKLLEEMVPDYDTAKKMIS